MCCRHAGCLAGPPTCARNWPLPRVATPVPSAVIAYFDERFPRAEPSQLQKKRYTAVKLMQYAYEEGVALSFERRMVPVPISSAVWNEAFGSRRSQVCGRK